MGTKMSRPLTIPDDLPDDAKNLIRTIDLQLDAIKIDSLRQDDEAEALRQQRLELYEWRQRILAEPATASLIKEEEEDDDRPAKRRKLAESECVTCMETFENRVMVKLQCCKDRYCKECFQSWFEAALDSRELPKCCDIGIEPKDYSRNVGGEIKKKYKALVKEIEAERKLWCSNLSCRVFIKIDQDTAGFVQCKKCRRKTCSSCALGPTAHRGRNRVCASYVDDDTLNQAVTENRWKRCPACHVPVEKTHGCNNIRCTCRVIFCFRCGVVKQGEFTPCKCSHPTREFNFVAEDATNEEE